MEFFLFLKSIITICVAIFTVATGNVNDKIPVDTSLPVLSDWLVNVATEYSGESELPYHRPTPEEINESFTALLDQAIAGNLKDSQNPYWKEFSRNILVRMCDSDEYNLNFDYDPETGYIYDDDGKGLAKIGFDYDCNQGIFFSAQNPWMRSLGYCETYDNSAWVLGCDLITHRMKFDYQGREYMIQVWKGSYGWISYGAEIGIYVREPGQFGWTSIYEAGSDEDMIGMQFDLYKKDRFMFSRPYQNTWWLTGFIINDETNPEDIRVDAALTLKDEEMRDLFLEALEKEGLTASSVDGLTVKFSY